MRKTLRQRNKRNRKTKRRTFRKKYCGGVHIKCGINHEEIEEWLEKKKYNKYGHTLINNIVRYINSYHYAFTNICCMNIGCCASNTEILDRLYKHFKNKIHDMINFLNDRNYTSGFIDYILDNHLSVPLFLESTTEKK